MFSKRKKASNRSFTLRLEAFLLRINLDDSV